MHSLLLSANILKKDKIHNLLQQEKYATAHAMKTLCIRQNTTTLCNTVLKSRNNSMSWHLSVTYGIPTCAGVADSASLLMTCHSSPYLPVHRTSYLAQTIEVLLILKLSTKPVQKTKLRPTPMSTFPSHFALLTMMCLLLKRHCLMWLDCNLKSVNKGWKARRLRSST